MLKTLSYLFAGFFIAAVLWLLLVSLQVGNKTPPSFWTDGVHSKKAAHANAINTKKIVFIGGSNLLFGLDSKLMSDSLGLPVANMGINAGMPFDVVLAQGTDVLRPGDIAVFTLEYPMYSDNGDFTAGHIDYLLSHPGYFSRYSSIEQLQVYFSVSLARVIEGFKGLPADFNDSAGLYGAHNIDSLGDQINSMRGQRQPQLFEDIDKKIPKTYGKDFIINAKAIKTLQQLADQLAQDSICSVFIPPPMLSHHSYFDNAVEKQYYSTLKQHLRSQGLGYFLEPEQFMYPKDYFFDTPFHLTQEARQQHTHTLAKLLGAIIDQHCP